MRGDSRSSSRYRSIRRSSGMDCHPAGPASSRRRTHRSGKMVRLLSVPRPDNPAGEFYLSAVSQEAFQTSCNRCFLHSVCGGNVGI